MRLPSEDLDLVLDHTRECWEELRGKSVLITGGTGFFGRWLVESFCHVNRTLALDANLTILTRSPDEFRRRASDVARDPWVTLHAGDVRSFNFPAQNHTHVIHAATTSSQRVAPLEMLDTIIGGTRRTLECARTQGASKFLFISSGAVYGNQPVTCAGLAESYLGAPEMSNPESAYGEGKRVGELLCAIYSQTYGLKCTIARCFAFVGPYLPYDAHYAIGNFLRDRCEDKPIRVRGDGTATRSYLYAADLAAWLWRILFQGDACRPYNVGGSEGLTLAELARTVAETQGGHRGVTIAQRTCSGERHRYIPDTTRLRQELGVAEFTPLRLAIAKTLKWINANPV